MGQADYWKSKIKPTQDEMGSLYGDGDSISILSGGTFGRKVGTGSNLRGLGPGEVREHRLGDESSLFRGLDNGGYDPNGKNNQRGSARDDDSATSTLMSGSITSKQMGRLPPMVRPSALPSFESRPGKKGKGKKGKKGKRDDINSSTDVYDYDTSADEKGGYSSAIDREGG